MAVSEVSSPRGVIRDLLSRTRKELVLGRILFLLSFFLLFRAASASSATSDIKCGDLTSNLTSNLASKPDRIGVGADAMLLQRRLQLVPYLLLDVVALLGRTSLAPSWLPAQLEFEGSDESVRR